MTDNHKFKVGDNIIIQLNDATRYYGWNESVVYQITEVNTIQGVYYAKRMNSEDQNNNYKLLVIHFADNNCKLHQ